MSTLTKAIFLEIINALDKRQTAFVAKNKEMILKITKTIAIVACIFTAFVAFQLISNYKQAAAFDPASFTIIDNLRERLSDEPMNEELKSEIRYLDRLVRNRHFSSLLFTKAGAPLLLAGIVILLICAKILTVLTQPLPDPGKYIQSDNSLKNALQSRISVAVGLILIIITTIVLISLSKSNIEDMQASASAVAIEEAFDITRAWPGFRGPMGNGRAHFTSAPVEWNGTNNLNILWKSDIPLPGFSSPIVIGKQIFLTGADNDIREIYCFDADDGALIWIGKEENVPGAPATPHRVSEDSGYAAPTMATDGTRVFAMFGTGNVVCFDLDGRAVWSKYMGTIENSFGYASSLICHENILFVQYDNKNTAQLFALNSATGNTLWKKTRKVAEGWCSPILAETKTGLQLVLNGNPSVKGYDVKTGKELWSIDSLECPELASSPAYANGIVYSVSESSALSAIKLGETPEVIWKYDENLPDVSSPVASDEFLFMATGSTYLMCFNAKTGKLHWSHEFQDGFFSSPIIVGDRVYVMDKEGVMQIVEASSTFKLINSCALGEQSDCTPAFMRNRLYIRSQKYLYCISKEE